MNNYNEQIIRRGEIYYIRKGKPTEGCEQEAGRPAVIVSNNSCNTFSSVVEVVFLTTKEKNDLPTHVLIDDATTQLKEPSTALCEQINSVAKFRIGRYLGRVSDATMEKIDRALAVSIGLDCYLDRTEEKEKESDEIQIPEAPQEEEPREILVTHDEILAQYKLEAEFYKTQYKALLDRILEKI